jgi:thiol-disulfide isomerase/thioredoxin
MKERAVERYGGRAVIGAAAVLLFTALPPFRPSALRAQDVGMPIGTVPAAAVVQDTSGASVDLAQRYVGKKPVLFEFWASWCEICQALLPRMEAAQRRFGSRVDFVVVGVGVNQSLNSMKRHLARHVMPFNFYFDNTGAAVRAMDAPATSYIVVLDARGRTVYTGSGSEQDIESAVARALR